MKKTSFAGETPCVETSLLTGMVYLVINYFGLSAYYDNKLCTCNMHPKL